MLLRALLVATAMTTGLIVGQVSAGPATAGPVPIAKLTTAQATSEAEIPAPGPGWYLASVDHGPAGEFGIEPRRQRLVLMSPEGERTRVLGVRVGRHGRGSFRLVDWSVDGRTALLVIDAGRERQRAVIVDVPTGATTTVPLGERVSSVLLDAAGELLGTGYTGGADDGAPLWRIDAVGERTRLDARVDGPLLPSDDGTTVVTGARSWSGHAMRVLTADGQVQQRIATDAHCTPVRWWDDTTVEAQCWRHHGPTLALVDPATGEATALTQPHGEDSPDLGDLDARLIDSGLYLQGSGPCGYHFVARQRPDGSVVPVKVPGAVGNVHLVGGEGSELVIEHAISCDGAAPRSALSRFDPVTREERVLTLLPEDEAFGRILRYGERQASGF